MRYFVTTLIASLGFWRHHIIFVEDVIEKFNMAEK